VQIKHGWHAHVVHACVQRAHTRAWGAWAHYSLGAQGMLCVHAPSSTCGKLHCAFHVQQLSWGGASRAASSTEGEHPTGWPDSPVPYPFTGPHSFLTSPLDPDHDAVIIWWLTWENCLNSQANSYIAHRPQRPQGPPGEFRNFSGGTGNFKVGVQILARHFSTFAAGMWEQSHLRHPSQKIKRQGSRQGCRQVWQPPWSFLFFCFSKVHLLFGCIPSIQIPRCSSHETASSRGCIPPYEYPDSSKHKPRLFALQFDY